MENIQELLEVAKEAAFEAGRVHMHSFCKAKTIETKSNDYDLVTNVDKQAEEVILSVIKGHYPEHGFLAEEGGVGGNPDSDYLWIIDPLDGTTNYAHNFPHFCSSVGLYYKGKPYVGVVYDAFKEEMFFAAEGIGAFMNGIAIQVSSTSDLSRSLLATGFPYDKDSVLEENLGYFKKFLKKATVRRPGAAALDLCYLACGRLDGFWELNLKPWDVAASHCIILQAGGKVTNFNSEEFDYNIKNIVASNANIHQEIMDVINE